MASLGIFFLHLTTAYALKYIGSDTMGRVHRQWHNVSFSGSDTMGRVHRQRHNVSFSTARWAEYIGSGTRVNTAFSNVLLLIHCEKDDKICTQRWPIYEGYQDYFAKVKLMTRNECEDAKSLCIMDLMADEGNNYDGILYMHFDAIVSPCRLANVFNKDSLGLFSRPGDNTIGPDKKTLIPGLVRDATIFGVEWNKKVYKQWESSIEAIKKFGGEYDNLNTSRLFTSENDLFYIPKRAYKQFGDIEDEFAYNGIWHEIAGPTTRKIIEENFDIPAVNFGCKGACCQNLNDEDLKHPDFRCGHKFDLREEYIQKAYKAFIADRSEC